MMDARKHLMEALLGEDPKYAGVGIPSDPQEQDRLIRALFNVRPPKAASAALLAAQDVYLQDLLAQKGITDAETLSPTPGDERIVLWQGDITTLKADAIVNAANSALLGCFVPNHGCIDNAIHTFAGVQLRLSCDALMRAQGHPEPTGQAKITPGYNLPSRFVLHTVGPIIGRGVTDSDRALLASCYRACLALAAENGLTSVAFCCISTGEFHFPNEEAARIAVDTVKDYLGKDPRINKVIFNVFKDIDHGIYQRLLG